MGRGSEEWQLITLHLAKGRSIANIARTLNRDARTIKKATENIMFKHKIRCDKGKLKRVSERDIRKVKYNLRKHPLLSRKEVFTTAGVPDISKSTRCRVL